jgi:hypothetical protein
MPQMKDLRNLIDTRRDALARSPFLANVGSSSDLADLRAFLPQLYFYVLAFQDMLRIAHERVQDPEMRDIAGRHREEDAGHEQWFLTDAVELDSTRDVAWIFGTEHRPTRDFSYLLLSEILTAGDDRLRLLFPLVLEAAGAVFFERVVGLVKRSGYQGRLRYFAPSHQQVESAHEIFSDQNERRIDEIVFDPKTFQDARDLINRCFDACESMAAHLEAHRTAR